MSRSLIGEAAAATTRRTPSRATLQVVEHGEDVRGPVGEADGRHRRSAQSREQVTLALLELLREGELQPTAQRIADRADVSARTVFRLFTDLDGLFASAVEAQQHRTRPLFKMPATTGTRSARVADFSRRRSRLFEEVAPVRRAAALYAPAYSVIREDHARIDAILRHQLETVFAPEIAALAAPDRVALVDGLDAATSWSFWETLRSDQGLSTAAARRAITRTVSALLESADPCMSAS